MLGLIGLAYMAAGYCCFWQVVKQIKPGRPASLTTSFVALLFGPLIFAFAVLRAIVDPYYRPVTAKFIEIKMDPSGQGQYQTVWQTRKDHDLSG